MQFTTKAEPYAQARATITEVPLVGEPATDKAYRCAEDAGDYRVRIIFGNAPDVYHPGVFIRFADITITRLNSAKKVERDAAGEVIFVSVTRVTLDMQTWRPDTENSLDKTIQRLIEQEIAKASSTWNARKSLDNVMAAWGATTGTSVTATVK